MRLKNLIQEFIESKDITIDQQGGNLDLNIYMNLMPNHGKYIKNGKGINYTNVSHAYKNIAIASLEEVVSIVNIKGPSAECGVTT